MECTGVVADPSGDYLAVLAKFLVVVEVENLLCRRRCREIERGRRTVHFTTWQTPRLWPQPHLFQIGTGGSIQVNGFRFCHNHGDEMCHTCRCDYRMTNNIRGKDHSFDMEAFDVEVSLALVPPGRVSKLSCRRNGFPSMHTV